MAYKQLKPHQGDIHEALLRAEQQEVRIVLVGKTGDGKSATGNTILGRKAFKATFGLSSVTSECEKATGEFEGQILSVVDTPGLFNTSRSQEEVKREIARCVSFVAPGPHVFLAVFRPQRFTEAERKTVKIIQKIFGEESAAYTMVLFTHGDDLEEEGVSVEDFINGNPALKEFIKQCGGGYIVFNNREKNPSQVRELLKKIDMMVLRNYFTNEMLREVRRAILKEMSYILIQNLTITFKETRSQAERLNTGFFMSDTVKTAVATGAALGSLGGPVGTAVGTAVGAAVGAISAICASIKREDCSIM